MNLNIDMSEIIEFVLPMKTEYAEHNNDADNGDGDDDDDGESNNQYVLLDAVDVGQEYKSEEFLLVNEDGNEAEMLIDHAELHQQLVDNNELQQAIMRLPKEEPFENMQFMVEETEVEADVEQDEELHDLVEEEDELVGEEEEEEQYDQYEQYEDDVEQEMEQQQQPLQPKYEWNYVEACSPHSEFETIEQDTKEPLLNTKSKSNPQSLIRSYLMSADDSDAYDDMKPVAAAVQINVEPMAPLAEPSDKMLDMFKGPRRYMLFDELIATIVDFDDDGTPIVEFSMMGGIQDEKLPVECGICPDVMQKAKLSKHQKTHLVSGTNRYACIYCTETYRDCKYLAGHARRHMGIRPYVCEPCKLYFSTKQDLRVHNQRRHLEKEHICEMCGKTFAQNTQLKRHREATHEKKRRFQCQYCQKAYYKNFSLQEHIRNVHMGKRRMLKCPFCGMQCRDAHKMARHRKEMHLNQDTYVCHLCQEEFTDINYFDAHKRSIQCRSNTRRLVSEDDGRTVNEDGQLLNEGEELSNMLEEDYDEDAGLLVDHNDVNVEADGEADADEMKPVYSNYLHEQAGEDEQEEEEQQEQFMQQQQFVTQFDQNNFEDDNLLVEQVPEDEEPTEEILGDDDQFLQQSLEQPNYAQHRQPFQHPLGREYNDDELIYEITLETEDN